MKFFVYVISFLLWSCQPGVKQKDATNQSKEPCENATDAFNTVSVFKNVDSIQPAKEFKEITNFLERKGNLKLKIWDSLGVQVFSGRDAVFNHYILCGDRYVKQTFILKNVVRNTTFFESTVALTDTSVCTPPCYPGFNLEQCYFANNMDRDSALKIIQWVYSNITVDPKSNVTIDNENEFSQIVVGNNRIYLFEPGGFKPFEQTAIEYANYLKQYLKKNSLE